MANATRCVRRLAEPIRVGSQPPHAYGVPVLVQFVVVLTGSKPSYAAQEAVDTLAEGVLPWSRDVVSRTSRLVRPGEEAEIDHLFAGAVVTDDDPMECLTCGATHPPSATCCVMHACAKCGRDTEAEGPTCFECEAT